MSGKCREEVWGIDSYRPSRCSRNAVVDGYCKMHSPAAKKERQEKSDANVQKFLAQVDIRTRKRNATAKLIEAVALCVMTGTSLPPIIASAYATLAEIPDA